MRSFLAGLLVTVLMTGCVGTMQSGLGGSPGLVTTGPASAGGQAADDVERALAHAAEGEVDAEPEADADADYAYGETLIVLGAALVSINAMARPLD